MRVAYNVKALAMWLEFIACQARLPMPDKSKKFSFCCPIALILLELKPNISIRPMVARTGGHIADAMLPAVFFDMFED